MKNQNNLSRAATMTEELKRARVIFLVVAPHLLSSVPMFTFLILRCSGKLADDNNHNRIVYTSAMSLNAICPPIIYGFKNQQFKTALLKMVKCT